MSVLQPTASISSPHLRGAHHLHIRFTCCQVKAAICRSNRPAMLTVVRESDRVIALRSTPSDKISRLCESFLLATILSNNELLETQVLMDGKA